MLFSRGAVVLVSAMIARSFGPTVFALFTFVHLTATSISNIAMLGMMNGLPRFFARMDLDPTANALTQALLSMAVGLLGLGVAVVAISVLPSDVIGLPDPDRKSLLITLTLSIGLNNLFIEANNGFEQFGRVAISGFLLGVVLIAGTAIAISLDAPQVPLLAYLVATILALIFLAPNIILRIVRQIYTQGLKVDLANFRAICSYLGPMFLATVMTNSGLWLAGRRLIDGKDGGMGFAEFALGMQWFGLALMASNVISKAVMPRMTRNVHIQDLESQRQTIRIAIALSLAAAGAVFILVAIAMPAILRIYGSEFSDSKCALMLFVAAAVVAAPIAVLSSSEISSGRYRLVFLTTLAWWLVLIVGGWINPGGAAGMIVFVLVGYLIQLIGLGWNHMRLLRG